MDIRPLTMTGKASLGVVSPDGKFVAYLQRDEAGLSIWLRVVATGSARQIVAPVIGRTYHSLAVTANGSSVDFVARDKTRDWDLWRAPLLGDEPPKRIATGLWSAVGWSSDGRQMAFIRNRGYALVVANADGSGERALATPRKGTQFHNEYITGRTIDRPAWSPDGTRIMLIAIDRTRPANTGFDLVWIDSASGAELRHSEGD